MGTISVNYNIYRTLRQAQCPVILLSVLFLLSVLLFVLGIRFLKQFLIFLLNDQSFVINDRLFLIIALFFMHCFLPFGNNLVLIDNAPLFLGIYRLGFYSTLFFTNFPMQRNIAVGFPTVFYI